VTSGLLPSRKWNIAFFPSVMIYEYAGGIQSRKVQTVLLICSCLE